MPETGDSLRKMDKTYAPKSIEEKWQKRWLDEDFYQVYRFRNDGRPTFVIDTPPPFTSGELHMGHAYWNILNDVLARYKRMKGFDVLLPQGWDCQGLPTELKVQYKWKIPREDRERFRAKCVEWTHSMIDSMKGTMIRLGYRPDWEQFEYKTMDREYWRAVQESLLMMHEKRLIYRKEFPIHWCSKCGTALAQAEVGYVQKQGKLYYIKFKAGDDDLEIATTRPELLPACVALAFNPSDGRYARLKEGNAKAEIEIEAEVPVFGQKVKILEDDCVDPGFGTGMVMVCTYGDEQDIKWQQKYKLPIIRAIDEYGRMMNAGKYTGMKASAAREEIVRDLEGAVRIARVDPLTHSVLTHTERADCMTPIEFIVKDQWFVRSKEFRDTVLEESAKMRWIPKFMSQRLVDWVNSIEWDWLISRQRVFGTPVPFWYCRGCGAIIPPRREDLPVDTASTKPPVERCPSCGGTDMVGTSDVCDCWVDSSISPLIVTGFFGDRGRDSDSSRFQRTYPADYRQQGHDIIRTWFYYSTLRCTILTGRAPFKGVLVNGHILGPDGSRMSKSKGNVIMPEQGVNDYGADAIRQALVSLTLGSDFPFKWEPVKYGKSFLQKVWSSVRFAEGFFTEESYTLDVEHLEEVDRWILSRLRETVAKAEEAIEGVQFHIAIDLLQKFYWHDVCDQYVEALKPRLYSPRTPESQAAAKSTLYYVIWTFTRLLAPICPHITEEIYQSILKGREGQISIHATPYPTAKEVPDVDGRVGGVVINVISELRSKKVEAKMALSAEIPGGHIHGDMETIRICRENEWLIREVLHIRQMEYAEGDFKAELRLA